MGILRLVLRWRVRLPNRHAASGQINGRFPSLTAFPSTPKMVKDRPEGQAGQLDISTQMAMNSSRPVETCEGLIRPYGINISVRDRADAAILKLRIPRREWISSYSGITATQSGEGLRKPGKFLTASVENPDAEIDRAIRDCRKEGGRSFSDVGGVKGIAKWRSV